MQTEMTSFWEWQQHFSDEEACLQIIVKLRWPEGFCCPHCHHKKVMCQHFSGHKFTQIFAVFRILRVTNSHLQNVFSLGYKRPQYIQI